MPCTAARSRSAPLRRGQLAQGMVGAILDHETTHHPTSHLVGMYIGGCRDSLPLRDACNVAPSIIILLIPTLPLD
jgi:hypothetical protein